MVIKGHNFFGTIRQVKETQANMRGANNIVQLGYKIFLKTKDGAKIIITDSEENALDGSRNAHGLLLVKRLDFEKVNGYNKQIVGWGWEDVDIICRLVLYAKLKHILFGTALHITHGDNFRIHYDKKYENRWHNRDCMFRQSIALYDKEIYMGTYAEDSKSCEISVEDVF